MEVRVCVYNIILLFCLCSYFTYAQLLTTNNPPFDTEQAIVTNVLLGDGIDASNFTSVGFANGIGYFDGFNSNIGFEEGVVLSTGGIGFVSGGFGGGSGVSGDPDLELALNAINLTWPVNNVTILEFDFIAESESMAFNYVFGSSEYSGYTCTQFNDIFGFFLSGPGINGPYSNNGVNLAYIPDPNNPGQYTTTPVAVNTVNSGSPTGGGNAQTCADIDPNWQDYSVYWIDNSVQATVFGINGFTVPFIAEYNNLICGETYHIKLAIADASDTALNSAVFLEANSFASPEVEISTVPNTELGLVLDIENGVLEGCGEVAIQFDRGGDLSMDLNVTLDYSGNALYGVDYQELPTEIMLPAFQEQIVIPIEIFYDNINEGQESLNITVSGVPVACEDVTEQTIEIIILDQDALEVDIPSQINMNCTGSALIEASVQGGYPPYNYTWYDQFGTIIESGQLNDEGVISIEQFPEQSTNYTLSVTDDCLDQLSEESTNVIVENEALSVSLGTGEDLVVCQEDLENIILEPEVVGGVLPYNYTWFYNGEVISNQEILIQLPGDGLYQVIVEEACGNIDATQVNVSFIELAPYVEIISYDVLNPLLLPEGCFQSLLQFNTQVVQDQDVILEFEISGSASSEDYEIETNTVMIPAGEEMVSIPLSIIIDEQEEGLESIIFNFPFIDECSDWPNQITVQIYDSPNLIVDIDNELVLCENDVASLEGYYSGGLGNINYGWYFDDQLITSDLNLSTDNLDPGLYSFVVNDQCGNVSQQDINYSIIELTPTVSLSSLDYSDPSELIEGCGSSTLTFEMPYTYPNDTIFYFNIVGSPTFVNGMDVVEIDNFINVPAGENTIDVEITPLIDVLNEGVEEVIFEFPFATNCVPQDLIAISINNYSNLEITMPSDETVCVGQLLDLNAYVSGGFPPYETSWTYLNQSANSSFISIDVQEGINQAIFTVTDNCGYSDTSSIAIEGLSVDDFEVVWPPNEVVACYGDNSEISLVLEGGLPPFTFQWYLDGVPTNSPSPYLPWSNDNWLPDASQTIATSPPYTPYEYIYMVEITDSCQNEAIPYEILVTIDECIMPTAFTPNGDGNNDVFWVDFGDLSTPVSLEIFNRWGEIVFRASDYTPCANFESDCWDGTHFQQYGEKCSEGVYYYIFTYSNPINNTDNYNVSNFTESIFGTPHNNSEGRQRTGTVLLFH